METVNIHQAKTNLSRLLSRVEHGEEIIISNRGVPVAKLVPFRELHKKDELLAAAPRYPILWDVGWASCPSLYY